MVRTGRLGKVVRILLGTVLFAPIGACRSPGISDPSQAPYSAFRPRYEAEGRKRMLFLGGYAGFNYGPVDSQTQMASQNGGETWGYRTARPPFSGWFRQR